MKYPEIFLSDLTGYSESEDFSGVVIEGVKNQIKRILEKMNEYLMERKISSIQKKYPKFSTEKIQEILHNSVLDPVSRSNEAQKLLEFEKLSGAQSLAIEHMHMAGKLFAKPGAELTASLKAKIKAGNAVFDKLIADLNQETPIPVEEISRLKEEKAILMQHVNLKRLMDHGIIGVLSIFGRSNNLEIRFPYLGEVNLNDRLISEMMGKCKKPKQRSYLEKLEQAFIDYHKLHKVVAQKIKDGYASYDWSPARFRKEIEKCAKGSDKQKRLQDELRLVIEYNKARRLIGKYMRFSDLGKGIAIDGEDFRAEAYEYHKKNGISRNKAMTLLVSKYEAFLEGEAKNDFEMEKRHARSVKKELDEKAAPHLKGVKEKLIKNSGG